MSEIDIPTLSQNAVAAFKRGGAHELTDYLVVVRAMYDTEPTCDELGQAGLFEAMAAAAVDAFESRKPSKVRELIMTVNNLGPRFGSFEKVLAAEFADRAKKATSQRQSRRLRDGAFTFVPRGLVLAAFGTQTRSAGEFRREFVTT